MAKIDDLESGQELCGEQISVTHQVIFVFITDFIYNVVKRYNFEVFDFEKTFAVLVYGELPYDSRGRRHKQK